MTWLRARWLGRLPYLEAWDLQRALHQGRTSGRTGDDYLLLLEHPHTFTVGKRGDGSNLLASLELLRSLGAELHWPWPATSKSMEQITASYGPASSRRSNRLRTDTVANDVRESDIA